ncbi:MAG: helix-turn-helix transcriptional regulator [Clostridia bacterium]|nr:helix-turn-helix transcriptional regulator [Clostridia bacterium]
MSKEVGLRIKQRREALGWTQEEFAEKIGVGPNYISLIERGESFPRYEVLISLLNGLEVSADDIFQDVLNVSAEYKASQLWEKVKDCSEEKQKFILAMVEAMLEKL